MRLAGLVALFFLAVACTPKSADRTYDLKGQVLAVEPEAFSLLVKHEDIPGFMPAMTMPYQVQDEALLKGLSPGDLIDAKLVVGSLGGAWLSTIKKTGTAPLPPDAPSKIPVAANVHLLQSGDEAPATPLTASDGSTISLGHWKGSAVALTFIYTRCPLAQYCPLLDRRFAELQKAAADDPATRGRVRLLSVSFDPDHDSGAVLTAHANTLGADPKVWAFATAPAETVDRLAAEFGVNVIREKDGTITHNLRTAVIDPAGKIVAIRDNNAWTAADLLADLKGALGGR